MKKNYVSLETAKTLKEKGYEELCIAYYNTLPSLYKKGTPNWELAHNESAWSYNRCANNPHIIDAPELHEVQQWLREEHGIEASCFATFHSYECQVVDLKNKKVLYKSTRFNEEEFSFDYAKVFEEGINEALKII